MALSLGLLTDKKYPVTRSYKAHPKVGCPGPDIGTPMGTPLKAVVDGTIVSGVNPDVPGKILPIEDWGKYIWLTSSENKAAKFGYAHLSKFKVRSGKVKKGQVIAYSGNSGYSFGAHLHFAFSYHGKCIDPLNSPSVVKWESEGDPMVDKTTIYKNVFISIMAKWPNKYQIKSYLDSKTTPYAYAQKHLIPKRYVSKAVYNKLSTTVAQQKAKLKTLAGQIKGLQVALKDADVFSNKLLIRVDMLEEELESCQETLESPTKQETEWSWQIIWEGVKDWIKSLKKK